MSEQEQGGHQVLFVDDESEYAQVMTKRLGRRGIQVMAALGGVQALELASQHAFRVAVVDIKMEGMDGLSLLRELRQLRPQLKAIMITGHGSADLARQCQELGAFAYFNKPCDLEELGQAIQQAWEAGD